MTLLESKYHIGVITTVLGGLIAFEGFFFLADPGSGALLVLLVLTITCFATALLTVLGNRPSRADSST